MVLDYFFQTEMAEQFNAQGYFYALDLRKYGRSKLPHQIFYNVLDLNEYDAEITQALEIIGETHSGFTRRPFNWWFDSNALCCSSSRSSSY